MKLNMTFGELKDKISEHRQEAENEARQVCSCVRSRGAWLVALSGDNNITESSCYEVKTLKRLLNDIEYLQSEGANKFYIDGGFDGADNVRDLDECYDPWISEWSFELEVVD